MAKMYHLAKHVNYPMEFVAEVFDDACPEILYFDYAMIFLLMGKIDLFLTWTSKFWVANKSLKVREKSLSLYS